MVDDGPVTPRIGDPEAGDADAARRPRAREVDLIRRRWPEGEAAT